MTPEQKRIAIAEACGARIKRQSMKGYKRDTVGEKWVWRDGSPCAHPGGGLFGWGWNQEASVNELPDYLNDLNACAKMRKILVGNQQVEYAFQLKEICCPITGEDWAAIDATAEQHCEAFGLTLGLWK